MTWSSSTSFFAACRLCAGLLVSSITVMWTGWPLIPPWLLTHAAHALAVFPVSASEPAWGPVQLQIIPTLIGAPAGEVAVAAACVAVPGQVDPRVLPPDDELGCELLPHAAMNAAAKSASADIAPRNRIDFMSLLGV
jgi:hypothetical protein